MTNEQEMLSKMQESGNTPKDKWNKPKYYESDEARQAAILKEMQTREWSNEEVSEFMYPSTTGEIRPYGPRDVIKEYTPSSIKPMRAGFKQGIAAIASLPNFVLEDLPKVPLTFAQNVMNSGTSEEQQPYFPSSDAAMEYYLDPEIDALPLVDLGLSEEDLDYPPTPGNVLGQVSTMAGVGGLPYGGVRAAPVVGNIYQKGKQLTETARDTNKLLREVAKRDPVALRRINEPGTTVEAYASKYHQIRDRVLGSHYDTKYVPPWMGSSAGGRKLPTPLDTPPAGGALGRKAPLLKNLPYIFDPLESKLYAARDTKMNSAQIRSYLNNRQTKPGSLGQHMGKVNPNVWKSNPELEAILNELPPDKPINPLSLLIEPWVLKGDKIVEYRANHILRHDLQTSGLSKSQLEKHALNEYDAVFDGDETSRIGMGEFSIAKGLRPPIGTTEKMAMDRMLTDQYTGAKTAFENPWGRSTSMSAKHPEYRPQGVVSGHPVAPWAPGDPIAAGDFLTQHPWAVSFSRGARFWDTDGKPFYHPDKKEGRPWQVIQEIQSDQIQEFEKTLNKVRERTKTQFDKYVGLNLDAIKTVDKSFPKQDTLKLLDNNLKSVERSDFMLMLEIAQKTKNQMKPSDWDFIKSANFRNLMEKMDELTGDIAVKQDATREITRAAMTKSLLKQAGLDALDKINKETGIDLLSAKLGRVFKDRNTFADSPTRPSLSGTSLRDEGYEVREVQHTSEQAWSELGVERGRVSRAINHKIPQETIDDYPDLSHEQIRKKLIAQAHYGENLEFAKYREIGNEHPMVQLKRKEIVEEFEKTHDMRKFRTATKEETPVGTMWGDHRDKYEKIFEIEDQVDSFIAQNWDQIYKDAQNAERAFDIANQAAKAAQDAYPSINTGSAQAALVRSSLGIFNAASQPQLQLKMGHTFYRDHLARALREAMIQGDTGIAWPLGADKEIRAHYGGSKMVYGSAKDKGRLGKAAVQMMQDMRQPKSSVKLIDNIATNPTNTPLDPVDLTPFPKTSTMRGIEITPEMVEHARKHGIPLSAVGSSAVLPDDEEDEAMTTENEMLLGNRAQVTQNPDAGKTTSAKLFDDLADE